MSSVKLSTRGGPLGLVLPLFPPPQLPPRPSHSPALLAHTVYSHIGAYIQQDARACTRTHAPRIEKHIFTYVVVHTCIHKNRHAYETYSLTAANWAVIKTIFLIQRRECIEISATERIDAWSWGARITQDTPCNSNATSTDLLKNTSTDSLTIVKQFYTIKSCSLNGQYTCTHTCFPPLSHTCPHPTAQWIGKSKWQRGRARESERLEEMKRVKRKEGTGGRACCRWSRL